MTLRSARDAVPALLALALFPVVAHGLNSNLSFGNGGHPDSWYAFGIYHHYPEMIRWFPNWYQLGRVPHMLPGYLLFQALPWPLAHYAVWLLWDYLAVFSLYAAARTWYGPRGAFLGALAVGGCTLTLGVYARDYLCA